MSPFDLETRRPVWNALSTMLLDTDVRLDRSWRASALAASPYSLSELERILVDEVEPVCRSNLRAVAGEWAGFDLDMLQERILERLRSPFRVMHRLRLGGTSVLTSEEWDATKAAVAAMRSRSSPE